MIVKIEIENSNGEMVDITQDTSGDVKLIYPPIPPEPDIVFRWMGWYFRSRHTLLGFPIWLGPFEFKQQAERARNEEA